MLLKESIFYAAMFLQLDGVTAAIENDTEPDKEDKDILNQLVRCANLVINEAACDYLPLKTTQRIEVKNGEFEYSNFDKEVIDIYSIKDNGKNVKFKQFFDRITLASGIYTAEYSYMPGETDLNGSVPYEKAVLPPRVLAYGIACEYSLISGMSGDAVMWEKRFKDALAVSSSGKGEKSLKRRRWL